METKYWWESRTIWVQIVAIAFVLLNSFGLLPADLSQEEVLTAIMGLVAAITIVLRIATKKQVTTKGSGSNVG